MLGGEGRGGEGREVSHQQALHSSLLLPLTRVQMFGNALVQLSTHTVEQCVTILLVMPSGG